MRDARRGNACSAKHFAAEKFVAVTRIFDGIVQVDAAQSVKFLRRAEPGKIEGQVGLVVDFAEAADVAFYVDGDVFVRHAVFGDRRMDVFAGRLAQASMPAGGI